MFSRWMVDSLKRAWRPGVRVVTVLLAGMALLLVLFAACSDDPYPVQPSSNSSLLSFALAGVAGSIDATVVPHRIDVVLPEGQSLSSLIATFTLPAGAKAFVNTIEQQSGSSSRSYANGYVSWIIKAADGALREYRVYAWAGAISSTSASTSSSTASGGTSSSQTSTTSSSGSVASAVSAASPVGKLLITEWGDVGTYNYDDYIELRNFADHQVEINTSLAIVYGSGKSAKLTKYGTGPLSAEYTPLGTVNIAPGEVILVVPISSRITNFAATAGVKFFVSDQTKLIDASGERLSGAPAKLTLGSDEWSGTAWPWTAGTTTYSKLVDTFVFGTDSTQDDTKWVNGNVFIRTPGVWP